MEERKAIEQVKELLKLFVESGGACELPGWVRSVSEDFSALIEHNRLTALVGKLCCFETDLPEWFEKCRQDYLGNMIIAEKQLAAGAELWAQLEQAGISCLAMKGPFAGVGLYGDCAVRRSMDIDLLVRPQDSKRAFELARGVGYSLREGGMTPGFYRRYHLHWSMKQEQKKIWLDLHWRLDHPFSLSQVDVNDLFAESVVVEHNGLRWREAEVNRAFLMLCCQLWKECGCIPVDRLVATVNRPVLDLFAFVRKNRDRLDTDWIEQRAGAWKMLRQVQYALSVMRLFWGEALPEFELSDQPEFRCRPGRRFPLGQSIEAGAVFRAERLQDIRQYIWPPRDWFEDHKGPELALKRTLHAGRAGAHVSSAALELVSGLCMRRLRKGRA